MRRARRGGAVLPVARHHSRRMAPGSASATRPFVRNAPAAAAPVAAASASQAPPASLRRIAARPAKQRGREEEREQPVGQVRAGHEKADRAREQQDARRQALAPAPARSQHEQERGAESREAGGQAGRPRRLTEDPEGGRVRPVEQGRLFEIGQAVQPRHDEVPGGEHLAGDLGVARLVRLGQGGARGLAQDDGRQQQEGRVEDPLAPRSVCRCLHGRFRSLPSAVLRFPPL